MKYTIIYMSNNVSHIHVHEKSLIISTINGKKEEEKKRKKQTNIIHTQATYCTHKQQLHQLRKIVPQPQVYMYIDNSKCGVRLHVYIHVYMHHCIHMYMYMYIYNCTIDSHCCSASII